MRARLSFPEPGRSLGATVARMEQPIRDSIQLLVSSNPECQEVGKEIFSCSVYGPQAEKEPYEIRLAWFVVACALAHALVLRKHKVAKLSEAVRWFMGDTALAQSVLACFAADTLGFVETRLRDLHVDESLNDLLPYVLEPHGHVTRSRIETCNVARGIRSAKREDGVYYTPSDVADFLTNSTAAKSTLTGSWLDPACGTGVLLRAIAARLLTERVGPGRGFDYVLLRLFAIDKSALATDLASFVVFITCALTIPMRGTPIDFWRKVKRNIVCMDALRLVPRDFQASAWHDDTQFVARLADVFPTIGSSGFDRIVMNPPYSSVSVDSTLRKLWHSFSKIAVGQSGDAHLAFVEMTWRLASQHGSAAAVLPLSVATNTTNSYLNLRRDLLSTAGRKCFLFFDREPQSLFGEDIKTRNVILIRHGGTRRSRKVNTTRLLKWTGSQRNAIFSSKRSVSLDDAFCMKFIPKLGSTSEVDAYERLNVSSHLVDASRALPTIGRLQLADIEKVDKRLSSRMLVVGGTAYNFINSFFTTALPKSPPKPYSSSPVVSLALTDQSRAYAAFAVLSSRMFFWLWHVESDGFHVTNEFLRRNPLWAILRNASAASQLANDGRQLWKSAAANVTGALNAGKQTYSFHPGYDHPLAASVERRLVRHFGLAANTSDMLTTFIDETVFLGNIRRMRRANLESNAGSW